MKKIIILVLAGVLLSGSFVIYKRDKPEYVKEIYVVNFGDTLWDLSAEYCDERQDRRDWIDDVARLNGGVNIKNNDEIVILVQKEKSLQKKSQTQISNADKNLTKVYLNYTSLSENVNS